jgi:hypothetical protein
MMNAIENVRENENQLVESLSENGSAIEIENAVKNEKPHIAHHDTSKYTRASTSQQERKCCCCCC